MMTNGYYVEGVPISSFKLWDIFILISSLFAIIAAARNTCDRNTLIGFEKGSSKIGLMGGGRFVYVSECLVLKRWWILLAFIPW